MTSPTPYWSSISMKMPDRKSRTRFWAPKPTATPTMPAPAISGPRLSPSSERAMRAAMVSTVADTTLRNRAATVSTRRALPLMSRASRRFRTRRTRNATTKMKTIFVGLTSKCVRQLGEHRVAGRAVDAEAQRAGVARPARTAVRPARPRPLVRPGPAPRTRSGAWVRPPREKSRSRKGSAPGDTGGDRVTLARSAPGIDSSGQRLAGAAELTIRRAASSSDKRRTGRLRRVGLRAGRLGTTDNTEAPGSSCASRCSMPHPFATCPGPTSTNTRFDCRATYRAAQAICVSHTDWA